MSITSLVESSPPFAFSHIQICNISQFRRFHFLISHFYCIILYCLVGNKSRSNSTYHGYSRCSTTTKLQIFSQNTKIVSNIAHALNILEALQKTSTNKRVQHQFDEKGNSLIFINFLNSFPRFFLHPFMLGIAYWCFVN